MTSTKLRTVQACSVLLLGFVLVTPAGAEATTGGMSYAPDVPQDDAQSGKDAPDACVAGAPSELDLLHDTTQGNLLAIDDERDVYTVEVGSLQTLTLVQDVAAEGPAGARSAGAQAVLRASTPGDVGTSTTATALTGAPGDEGTSTMATALTRAPAVEGTSTTATALTRAHGALDPDNPFAVAILNASCTVLQSSADPWVIPRTFTVDSEGTYQIVVYQTEQTVGHPRRNSQEDATAAMCHPPCRMNGYEIVIEFV